MPYRTHFVEDVDYTRFSVTLPCGQEVIGYEKTKDIEIVYSNKRPIRHIYNLTQKTAVEIQHGEETPVPFDQGEVERIVGTIVLHTDKINLSTYLDDAL